MKNIWTVLNSPLVVVITALAIWPIFTALSGTYALKFGIKEIASSVSNEVVEPFRNINNEQEEELKNIIEILKDIEVNNVNFAHSSWPGKIKVIGTINNKSNHTVSHVNISSSFYKDGKLVDVKNDWLSQIKAILPGQSENFTFDKDIQENDNIDLYTTEIKVSSISILQ